MSAAEASTVQLPPVPPSLSKALAAGSAVAWNEPLSVLTYEAGEPSRHPMYFDHRVYQGSSGRIYPVPFVEDVANEGAQRQWEAVHLENEFVRLVVLPELGGRIHIGYDKTTGYDFFYRNNVIKPALVGLGGPWISGGVEFNWPQHHRPGTYLPVQTKIEFDDDGSVTVWCHDHDPFERMSAEHGVRLRAGSSVVELAVRLHNRTSERQTFLWWANVAARVNDGYQSFFPQDVRYVADHARRAITAFPEADREYYGVDYPALQAARPGANRIDFYRNIPVPTSYMVVDSQQEFFGGYDHQAGAGFVHWAERRVSPGKKQWTWGNSAFGHAWDDQLTDSDGPYVELMAGVYTDNQPDFSWLLPGEVKTFTQYWYPIGSLGPAHQATPDAAVHVAPSEVRFAVTSPQPGAQLRAFRAGETVASRDVDMAPGEVERLSVADADRVELRARDGRSLVRWEPAVVADEEPWAAEEPPRPEEIGSVDELYLTGLHLAQYRHPTRSPLDYWEEGLRRDQGDVRCNLAVADRAYRAGNHQEALALATTAMARLTCRNTNPTDTEGYYLLGLIFRRTGRLEDAVRAFGKAGWDATWSAAAGFELAQLLAWLGRNRAALRVLDSIDDVVGYDPRRVVLRAILRQRGGHDVSELLSAALRRDPLDAALRVLARQDPPEDAGILLDVAFDLAKAGEAEAAVKLFLAISAKPATPSGNVRPIACYAAAQLLDRIGRREEADACRARAREVDLAWAFPCGLDHHDVLTAALQADPDDRVAAFLLGMLLYHNGRRVEAMSLWDGAIARGDRNPVLLRCAALAAYNIAGDDTKAWRLYQEAVEADPRDARLRYEQDQLAIRLGHSPVERLSRLSGAEDVVLVRDDLTIEYIGLLAELGQAERGLQILTTRRFHPWEGGEGKALAAWDKTRAALGLPPADPPATLGEARPEYTAPAAVRDDGVTDYFATSLPELLLFTRRP